MKGDQFRNTMFYGGPALLRQLTGVGGPYSSLCSVTRVVVVLQYLTLDLGLGRTSYPVNNRVPKKVPRLVCPESTSVSGCLESHRSYPDHRNPCTPTLV